MVALIPLRLTALPTIVTPVNDADLKLASEKYQKYLDSRVGTISGTIVNFDKKERLTKMANPLILLVPGTRIELVQCFAPRDFKSLASTCSATRAFCSLLAVLWHQNQFKSYN